MPGCLPRRPRESAQTAPSKSRSVCHISKRGHTPCEIIGGIREPLADLCALVREIEDPDRFNRFL
nr:hypothetical protein [Kibdelosporangium sp. MJ126-NF4]CTQ89271.1 hypothetical protein [Kibdelosporangium sp. MJ126-NF4]